ncbi:nuclease-related domain-containing protein [Nocardioides marmorisolisilvae]|nr:nuclease-related domain-containing protein [Nocardioides marmorisolisilvae]
MTLQVIDICPKYALTYEKGILRGGFDVSVHAESAERTGRSGARKAERGDDRAAAIAGLDLLRAVGWLVLHDVAVPGEVEVPIDHVLAGPSGVYVINTVGGSGSIRMGENSLLVAGVSQYAHVEDVAAAALALREAIGGRPVVPILCFQRPDEVAGVVTKVAVCSTENILELLNGQPKVLDAVAANEVMRTLTGTLGRQTVARAVTSVPDAPQVEPKHRVKVRKRLLSFGRSAADDEGPVELSVVAPLVEPVIDEAEVARAEAERADAERVEAERVEAERVAAEQAARLEAERLAVAEAARVEAERVAAEEAARLEAERLAAEEAARVEAERVAAEEAARLEAERLAAEEAARIEAERLAAEEAARVEAERLAAEEAARVEAERLAAEEAARLAEEEAARIEAERLAAEETARLEAERLAAEEAARLEAERLAAEEAARLEAERVAAEEAARLEAERLAAAEAARLEAERVEAERLAAEEAARIEAAALDAARAEAARIQAEKAERVRPTPARVKRTVEPVAVEPVAVETYEDEVVEPDPYVEEPVAFVEVEEEPVAIEPEAAPVARQTRGRDSSDPIWRPIGPAAKRVDMKSAIKMVSAAFARKDEEPEFDLAEIETALKEDEPVRSSLPAWFGAQAPVPAAAQAAEEPVEEEPTKKRRISLMPAVVAAAVIAVIFGVAPRLPDAYAWGKSFFVTPAPPSLGQTTIVAQTGSHPAIEMMAGIPLDVKSANGISAGKGRHLVGVPIRATSQGSTNWSMPVATAVRVVDTLGITHAPDGKVTRVRSGKVLGSRVTLVPGRLINGMVVFAIQNGREISSVQVTFAKSEQAHLWNAVTGTK